MRKQNMGAGRFFNYKGWDTVVWTARVATQFQIYFKSPTFDFN